MSCCHKVLEHSKHIKTFQGYNSLKTEPPDMWDNRISAVGWKWYKKKVPLCVFDKLTVHLLDISLSPDHCNVTDTVELVLGIWSRMKDACRQRTTLSSNWPLSSLLSLPVWVALWSGNNRLAQQRDRTGWRMLQKKPQQQPHLHRRTTFPKPRIIWQDYQQHQSPHTL